MDPIVRLRGLIGLCAVWLIINGSIATGKEWRGIVPLKSTRADVERVFGPPKLTSYSGAYYSLPNEIVVFDYQVRPCEEDMFGFEWNVPIGTVVGIGVIPKGAPRRQEYELTSDFKIEDRGAGFIYYSNDSAGFALDTYKDQVTLLDYYPPLAQSDFHCPKKQNCCVDFFHRFDAYERLSFADEKARLDNFLLQMNSLVARGTIEIRGPSASARQQRLKQAARAKAYLVKKRGLDPERILIVDAGFSERPVTFLNSYSIGGAGSAIYIFADPDPKPAPPKRK